MNDENKRAGEISPVLRRLDERIKSLQHKCEEEKDEAKYAHMRGGIFYLKQVYEWLEDASPTPAQQPAHVPDPKTECTCICGPSDENPNCAWPNCFKPEKSAVLDPKGEIPDEITDWITHTAEQIWENERAIMEPGELAAKVATAMYRKMREEIGQFKRAARIASQNEDYCKQWLYKARQERDALQTTLDTAQQSKQVLIDALTAKSEESADCRKALGKIVFGSDGMLSLPDRARMYGIAQQTLAKYPKP